MQRELPLRKRCLAATPSERKPPQSASLTAPPEGSVKSSARQVQLLGGDRGLRRGAAAGLLGDLLPGRASVFAGLEGAEYVRMTVLQRMEGGAAVFTADD